MKNKIFALLLTAFALGGCEEEFLDKPPLDELTDPAYWSSESNVRTFSYGFYTDYFTGFGSGNSPGMHWSGNNQVLSDDRAPSTPIAFPLNVPTSGGGWTFSYVRKANIMIDRVQNMPESAITEEARAHWVGIGRSFRGLEYYDLVRRFGDVPYYDFVPATSDTEQLYKARESRTFVMDKVLEDFRYAVENVRLQDGAKGLTVNRDVILAYMSRVFLFEGTWQKYHLNNSAKAKEYLEASKLAANQVITSGRYRLGDYRDTFSSLDLSANPEVILYRQYEPGIIMHATQSYNNKESQSGASKDMIESYVLKDGLPIAQSPLYQGDKGMQNVVANRDPRLTETFVDSIRLQGMRYNGKAVYNVSTSGYVSHKYLNESNKTLAEGNSSINITDAPIIRYGEVLVNYAEAAAELATVGGEAFIQEDVDKSINVLRSRPGIGVAPLRVEGDQAFAGDVQIMDPERDASVTPILWEIRRERRVELVFEGFRYDDLRRWKKLNYVDTEANPEINRGAWVSRDHPDYTITSAIRLSPDDTTPPTTSLREGYVVPSFSATGARIFDSEKYYLAPLPLDQINFYKEQGYTLVQNPGWE